VGPVEVKEPGGRIKRYRISSGHYKRSKAQGVSSNQVGGEMYTPGKYTNDDTAGRARVDHGWKTQRGGSKNCLAAEAWTGRKKV